MMVAVLGGEEVAVAVQKEVVRAEEQAAAQAEAATRANIELTVLPVTESDQEPPRQEQDATTTAAAAGKVDGNGSATVRADEELGKRPLLTLGLLYSPSPHPYPNPTPAPPSRRAP